MSKIFASPIALVLSLLLLTSLHAQEIKFDEWKNFTTSGKIPPQCKIQKSNNNLDLVKYKDRYYLAFRTAPTHFASKKVVIYIISSKDLETWEYESEIKMGRDIREPRFIVYHDTLNMYMFTGGKKLFKFEPNEILITRTAGNKTWSATKSVNLDGYVPWRVRERNDTLYLSAYYGRNLYNNGHKSDLRLFYTKDPTSWKKLSVEPQVDVLAAEEGEFIFDKKGDMYATVRLEGNGSFICKADKSNIANWQKIRSKYKYDSALLFDHNDDLYLISRRNLDGEVDKAKHRGANEKKGRIRNLIRYSTTRKVTACFKFNKNDLSLTHITDFPSTGDTAYPGMVQLDKDTYLLMNYSSDYNKHKKNWIRGQFGKTYIYWTKVHFTPKA